MKKRSRELDAEVHHAHASYPPSILYTTPALPSTQHSIHSMPSYPLVHPHTAPHDPRYDAPQGTQVIYYIPNEAPHLGPAPPPHTHSMFIHQPTITPEGVPYIAPLAFPPAAILPTPQLQWAYTADGTPVYIMPASEYRAHAAAPPTASAPQLPSHPSRTLEHSPHALNLSHPPAKIPRHNPPTSLDPPSFKHPSPDAAHFADPTTYPYPTHHIPPTSSTHSTHSVYHTTASILPAKVRSLHATSASHPAANPTAPHTHGPRSDPSDPTALLRPLASSHLPHHSPHPASHPPLNSTAPRHTLSFLDASRPQPPIIFQPLATPHPLTPTASQLPPSHAAHHRTDEHHGHAPPSQPQPPPSPHRRHRDNPLLPLDQPPNNPIPTHPLHQCRDSPLHNTHPPHPKGRPASATCTHPTNCQSLPSEPWTSKQPSAPEADPPISPSSQPHPMTSPAGCTTPHSPGTTAHQLLLQGAGPDPSVHSAPQALPTAPGSTHQCSGSDASPSASRCTSRHTRQAHPPPSRQTGAANATAEGIHTLAALPPQSHLLSPGSSTSRGHDVCAAAAPPAHCRSSHAAATAGYPASPSHTNPNPKPSNPPYPPSSPASSTSTHSDPIVRPNRSGAPSPPSSVTQLPSPTSAPMCTARDPSSQIKSAPASPLTTSPHALQQPELKQDSRKGPHDNHTCLPAKAAAPPSDADAKHTRPPRHTLPPTNANVYSTTASPSASPTTTTAPHLKPDPSLPHPTSPPHQAPGYPPATDTPSHDSPPSPDSAGATSSERDASEHPACKRPPSDAPQGGHTARPGPGAPNHPYPDPGTRSYMGSLKVHRHCQHEGCGKRARASTRGKPMYCMVHMRARGLVPKAPMCKHSGCQKFAQQSADKSRDYCVVHMKERGYIPNALACQHPGCASEAKRACNSLRRFCPHHMRLYGVCPAPNTPGLPATSPDHPLSPPCRTCNRRTPLSPTADRSPPASPRRAPNAAAVPIHAAAAAATNMSAHHTYIIPANSAQAVRLPRGYAVQLAPDARTYATPAISPGKAPAEQHLQAGPAESVEGAPSPAGQPPPQVVARTAVPHGYILQVDPSAAPYAPSVGGLYHIPPEYIYAYTPQAYPPERLPSDASARVAPSLRPPTIIAPDKHPLPTGGYAYAVDARPATAPYPLLHTHQPEDAPYEAVSVAALPSAVLEGQAPIYYYTTDGRLVAAVDAGQAPAAQHHQEATGEGRQLPNGST